jgi:hypothetical protein
LTKNQSNNKTAVPTQALLADEPKVDNRASKCRKTPYMHQLHVETEEADDVDLNQMTLNSPVEQDSSSIF